MLVDDETISEIRERAHELLENFTDFFRQCHVASLRLVHSGLGDRVARGTCNGVMGEHSWVVIGNPYRPDLIIDPTLWSYREDLDDIYVGLPGKYNHRPKGAGQIWKWGKPITGGGCIVELTPSKPLSGEALGFLELIGPLDESGWFRLANAPVEGWPSSEIISAICDTEIIKNFVPIDIVGMVTDRNPSNLYMRMEDKNGTCCYCGSFDKGEKIMIKKLKVDIFENEINGNAYAILGAFQKQARKEGWTKEEIDEFHKEATSGDYDHLLQTCMSRIE